LLAESVGFQEADLTKGGNKRPAGTCQDGFIYFKKKGGEYRLNYAAASSIFLIKFHIW